MNRKQRRMQATSMPRGLQMSYGHNGSQVVIVLNPPTANIILTPAQVDDMIAALQQGKEQLARHQEQAHG